MSEKNGAGAIRVLLASTSAVRRSALETFIKKSSRLKLVASLHGVQTIAQRADELQPDVIVLDVEKEVPARLEWPVVALVEGATPAWTAAALRAGARAILARDSGAQEIAAAVQAAYAGFVLLDPELGLELAEKIRAPEQFDETEELTAREIEVLRLLGEGYANREMAVRLGISEHTVKFHISSILGKLGAETRTEAVSLGIRMGMIVV